MRYDTSWGLIFQQSFTGSGNIQYNVLNRYNNVNYNALTFQAGNVYIGSTTNSGTDDNTSFAFPDSTFFVRGPQTASSTTNITFRGGLQGNNNGKVKLWLASDSSHSSYIQSEHTGSGNTQLTFGTANGNTLPTERLKISNTGIVSFSNDVWHGCLTGNHRLYFSPNNTTYLKGHGTIPLVFRRGDDAQIMKFSNNGAAAINTAGYATENGHMATGSLTIGNTSQNYGGGQNWNTNTAGLMMECTDNTEIAVHDQGASIHSFMYYSTNGNIKIGRNMGYNTANVNIADKLTLNRGTYSEFFGTASSPSNGYIYHGNGNTTIAYTYTYFGDLVCKFNGSTWTTSWIGASSSAKIKKDIQDLDDNECLNKLLALRPVKYRYIDITKNFDPIKSVYGFIAEEVKTVLPEAVNDKEKELIPNIYIMGSVENDILTIEKELEIDVEYTCYLESETIKIKVLQDLSNNNYKIDKTYEIKTDIFVYGKVDDNFHILKKEYFHALTISSVQELHKTIIEQRNKINDLETRLVALEAILMKTF